MESDTAGDITEALREEAQEKANREQREVFILKDALRKQIIITRVAFSGDEVLELFQPQQQEGQS